MNKEEKEAIEKTLVEIINNYEEYYKGTETILSQISEDYKNANIILNLIKKLQKENTKLKEDNKVWQMLYKEHIKRHYVGKDKIREIVEKSYNDIDYFNRDIRKDLEDLLGE